MKKNKSKKKKEGVIEIEEYVKGKENVEGVEKVYKI